MTSPTWLRRVYDYFGAHNNVLRFENERQRAIQRAAFCWTVAAGLLLADGLLDQPLTAAGWRFLAAALLYGLVGLAFWFYLARHPRGGVHAQYVQTVIDPVMVNWGIYAAPHVVAWFFVLLLVLIVRAGIRYGLRTMGLVLVSAVVSAVPLLSASDYWRSQHQLSASLAVMLLLAYPLFARLIRTQEREKQLEVERTRVQAMEDAVTAKSEFLARVSHELRSPLQGILSALELAEGRFGAQPGEAELLSRIRRDAVMLNTHLRDLLTLARGDAGRLEINPVAFEACELVQTVVRELRDDALEKGLQLVAQVPDEPIFVVADAARIDQVLTNLLSNGIRYTPSGSVALRLEPYRAEAQGLRFLITDTGPGIPDGHLPSLFEPFTRFGELTRRGEGAGLGLAVVRAVLRYLGGSIAVHTEAGVGTTFTVDIPAEWVDAEAPRRGESPVDRVLVVDDRAEVLTAIASVVRELGVECDTAQSVAHAANLLGARLYSMVFLDLDMPVKTGRELAAETRRGSGPNSRTRIVSISANDAGEAPGAWPFDGHLQKPITRTALARAIGSTVPATVPQT